MNKIIIVEDDRIIRRSLCRAPWREHGFELVGEAANGEDAIELIEKEQPQVVISDISMPFMNGLEMAKILKTKSPHTKVVFLTGYEDFKYAQEAVKVKAFDYLLKPVKIDVLIEKVKNAATEFNKEMKKEKRFIDSLPLLEQRFLRKMITKRDGTTSIDVEKELIELGIQIEGSYYSVMLINITASDEEEDNRNKMNVTEIVRNYLAGSNRGYLFNGETNEMALLLSGEKDCYKEKNAFALDLLDQIMKIDQNATITIGRTYSNLFDVSTSFVESRLAMDMKHIMGTGRVYSIEDTLPNNLDNGNIFKALEDQFKTHINLGYPKKAKETLEQLSQAITENKRIQLSEIKLLALKYSTLLFYQIKKWEKEETEDSNIQNKFNTILGIESLQEMIAILQELIEEWSVFMSEEKNQNHYTLVDKAMQYMDENYHDEALTQQKVAEKIFVSAPYLSNLFKIEKGLNFGEYLLDLRMKKAMELLQHYDAKVYKVAESVGYSNPQYFSVCFKKYTGYTPGEYRKNIDSIA